MMLESGGKNEGMGGCLSDELYILEAGSEVDQCFPKSHHELVQFMRAACIVHLASVHNTKFEENRRRAMWSNE